MAKKAQRVSVNQLEKSAVENTVTVTLNGTEDVCVTVRRVLPLNDMLQLVADVVSSCVDAETWTYTPEAEDFAIRKGVVSMYGNINLPDNLEKQYLLLYSTPAYDQIIDAIDYMQFLSIKRAIEARINHQLETFRNTQVQKLNEIIAQFEHMTEQMDSITSSIGDGELTAFMQKISSLGNIDEGKLASAVLSAQQQNKPQSNDDSVTLIPKE
jgi:hypothetical protein